MTKDELLALADRVEALSGPDREVDAAVYLALNPHMLPIPGLDTNRFYDPTKTNARIASKVFLSGGATGVALRFTASLDAAMSLVPEGWNAEVAWFTDGSANALLEDDRELPVRLHNIEVEAATPALALTAAALRAQAAALENNHDQ